MTSSFTDTTTETFTATHAKRMASKVGTDLGRLRRLYPAYAPSEAYIEKLESEVIALLQSGYLGEVTYGFRKNDEWVLALKYHASANGDLVGDDDPGKIKRGKDLSGASFCSVLTYSPLFRALAEEGQRAYEARLPFQRTLGAEPGTGDGYWSQDLTYSAGGRSLQRSTFVRP